MRQFPRHPVLFRVPQTKFLRNYAAVWVDWQWRIDVALATAQSSNDAPLHAWMRQLIEKQRPLVRSACLQPAALQALLGTAAGEPLQAFPVTLGGLSHVKRPRLRCSFGGLRHWIDPLRKFTVFFIGEGVAMVEAEFIDLFDSAWSASEPLIRIHARALQPEALGPASEVAKRLSFHRHWRMGLASQGVTNVSSWISQGDCLDAIEVQARPELVALTVASRMLGQHLVDWHARFSEIQCGVEYLRDDEEPSLLPLCVSFRADKNPMVVAERLLSAEIASNLSNYWWMSRVLKPGRGTAADAGQSKEQNSISGLAQLARVAVLHASLMAQGHQATDTAAFRQRRESTQEALRGAVENAQGLHARTLGRLESAVIDGARQAMQWSDRIAHSTKATLHRSRPKKILVANLDLQDTTYSWMVQQSVCLRASQRGHIVDAIGPV